MIIKAFNNKRFPFYYIIIATFLAMLCCSLKVEKCYFKMIEKGLN
jgi:hypothetical protein